MSKSNGDPQLFGHDLFGDPIEPKKNIPFIQNTENDSLPINNR